MDPDDLLKSQLNLEREKMDVKPPMYSQDPNAQAPMSLSAANPPVAAAYQQPPSPYHQPPAGVVYQQPPSPYQQPPPGAYQQPPPGMQLLQPGYQQPPVVYQQPMQAGYVPQQQVYVQQPQIATTTVVKTNQNNNSSMRQAIPELPMAVAIILLIVNIFLPGIGTIIAGFCVFCCGNIGASDGSKFGTFCINFWVGIAQIFLIPFFFIGWVWSIMWGAAFIAIAGAAESKTTTVTTVR